MEEYFRKYPVAALQLNSQKLVLSNAPASSLQDFQEQLHAGTANFVFYFDVRVRFSFAMLTSVIV